MWTTPAPVILLLLAFALKSIPLTAQQPHVSDAPQVIEGPQTPVIAPPRAAETVAPLTNDTILRMHTAGLSDDLIVQTIAAQPGNYNTNADDLIALRTAGLSNSVLSAMAGKARRPLTRLQSTSPSRAQEIVVSPVNEIGVYYKDRNGKWTAIEPEIVHVVSGGFIKSTLTNGIIKPDRNGSVDGRESGLLLPRPIQFLIYTPDGVSATEYDYLRFRPNSKNREFRTLTGGVIHSKGGAQRDELPFTPTKVGPQTYTFTVGSDTPGGEYGILPPGTGNITNGGKIYTFAISE